MRAQLCRSLLLSILLIPAFATVASAQVVAVPNTGCADGSAAGTEVEAFAGQAPTVGNLTFAVEHVCAPGANAAFFFWGVCAVAPLMDWNLSDSCFGAWASLPGSCGNAIQDSSLTVDGGLTRQDGKIVMAFPIPSIPELVAFTQATPICIQFICVDLAAANPCLSVSAGLQVTIQ